MPLSYHKADDEYMVLAMKRFNTAKDGWQDRRQQALEDQRAVNVKGGQWNEGVKADRDSAGRPALEFNELHIPIQRIVNQARKDRPQPKIAPGDNQASDKVAEALEDRLRHIHVASQADVAYDGAVEDAATGGYGFYEITREYTDQNTCSPNSKPTFNQEPRIKRVLDYAAEYPDPTCIEPDYSDAGYWFSRFWMDRDIFKRKFKGKEPIDFDSGSDRQWVEQERVCIAKYWWVEINEREYVALKKGEQGYRDEFTHKDEFGQDIQDEEGQPIPRDISDDEILNTRTVEVRTVHCDTIDGAQKLGSEVWPGNWIPKIPVLGREKMVDGKRLLIGIIRFAVDAMKLKNASLSGVADSLQDACLAPWLVALGAAVGDQWKDCNRTKYASLIWSPYDSEGRELPAPTRNTWEAPIQALMEMANKMSDEIHRLVGYSDQVADPSAGPISGVAVERRNEQTDLNNSHILANLVDSQNHCAKVVMNLDFVLADTPRILKGRKADGTSTTIPVTMASEGHIEGQPLPQVPGFEDQEHIRYDIGQYNVVVLPGQPSFETKKGETVALLTGMPVMADPNMFMIYAPAIFREMGFPELADIATAAAPPAVQALIKGGQAPLPPEIQQQLVQKDALIQQLEAERQALLLEKRAKTQEIQGKMALTELADNNKLKLEQVKTAGQLAVQSHEHRHDATKTLLDAHHTAIKHRMDMLHESELAPPPMDPNQKPEAGA